MDIKSLQYPISREDAIQAITETIASYSANLPETGYGASSEVSDTDTGCAIDIKLVPSGKPVGTVNLTFSEDNTLETMIVEGKSDQTDETTILFPTNNPFNFTLKKYTAQPFWFFLTNIVQGFVYVKAFSEKVAQLADKAYHMGCRYIIPQVFSGRAYTTITLFNSIAANSKSNKLTSTNQKTMGVGSVEKFGFRAICIKYQFGKPEFTVGVTDTPEDAKSFKPLTTVKYNGVETLHEIFDQSADTEVSKAIETVASGNRITVDMTSAMDATGNEVIDSKLSGAFSHYKQSAVKPVKIVVNAINKMGCGVTASAEMNGTSDFYVTGVEQFNSTSGEPLYVCHVFNASHTPVMTFLIKDSNIYGESAKCDVQWMNNMRKDILIGPYQEMPYAISDALCKFAHVKSNTPKKEPFTDHEIAEMELNGVEDNIIIPDDDDIELVDDTADSNEVYPSDDIAKAFGTSLEQYFNSRNSHKNKGGGKTPVEIHDEPIGEGEYRLYSIDENGNQVSLGIIRGMFNVANKRREIQYVYPRSGKVINMAFSVAENMKPTDNIIRQLTTLQPKLKATGAVYQFNHNARKPEPKPQNTEPANTGISMFDDPIN